MGCCFSKKRRTSSSSQCEPEDRSPPSPEVETVKEVLSETPSAKPRPQPNPVANVVATKDREVEKLRKDVYADAEVSDLGSCVSLSLATDKVSEAAFDSSIATSSVAGPDLLSGRKLARDLGPTVRHDPARAAAASYGVCLHSARGSPSPPASATLGATVASGEAAVIGAAPCHQLCHACAVEVACSGASSSCSRVRAVPDADLAAGRRSRDGVE
jgi:hypothetical protein